MSGQQRYQNARFVLPDELYRQVLPYLSGKLVWFPKDREINLDERNEYIRDLRIEGLSVAKIAHRMNLTPRQVWRILKSENAKSQPSPSGVAEKYGE